MPKLPSTLMLCCLTASLALTPHPGAQTKENPRAPAVTALAYSPDGKQLFAGRAREVLAFDVATGELIARVAEQGSKVTALACSPDGKVLAVASGEPGRVGYLKTYQLAPGGIHVSAGDAQPIHAIEAHADLIHDLAFSPDGKLLATCGYDRLVKLWELQSEGDRHQLTRKEILRDHSDAVYGVAFSPDGKLLASAGADRAVKVWEVATGKRLYTLGEATDWLYAVAWSPGGRHLAAAGVDRSIRVWSVSPQEGQITHSIFGHAAPITRLKYAHDGKTLYSLGEDGSLKAWNAAMMVETMVFPPRQETVLALALRNDDKQLAVGQYDGVLRLLDAASGKVQSELLPIKPKPPNIARLVPAAMRRGQTARVRIEGTHLANAEQIVVNHPSVTARVVATPEAVEAEIVLPPDLPAGVYQLQVKSAGGTSNALPFVVDLFPSIDVASGMAPSRAAHAVDVPATLVGKLTRPGEMGYFHFAAREGDEIGVQIVPSPGNKLEPVVTLANDHGEVLAEGDQGLLGWRCRRTGTYVIGVRDREYRAEAVGEFRLNVGPIPIVTGVFPLGLQRGTEVDVRLEGVHLPSPTIRVKAPADAAIGARLPVVVQTRLGTALGGKTIEVGEFPEILADAPGALATPLHPPITVNGQLAGDTTSATHRFVARKGERVVIEVRARRHGSALDPFVEILDGEGKPIPRATLRSRARTYLTFRDHDAATPNLRIESWSEFAINDYVMLGNELLRIKAMPTHPDADMVFFSVAGQRTGYLGTTPAHLAMGTPAYKVEVHPPGVSFPPSGYPNFVIYHRNDDGGPGYGKDSRLDFDPPADGEFLIRVGDAGGYGNTAGQRGYRLTLRPPRPSFSVRFNPASPSVAKGGAVAIDATADRVDGFDDAVALRLENLPPGFHAPDTTIPAGENGTSFALYAEPGAVLPEKPAPLRLVARAVIQGKEVVREASGGPLKLVEPGDILTVTEQAEVSLRPGGEARLTTRIERRNGFKGRVPLDVKGLPHGVKVRDIGLNGILITEKEVERTFVLYAEPWVPPQEHPIVVLARQEGKNAEAAARSVLLKVVKGQ